MTIPADRGDTVEPYPKLTLAATPTNESEFLIVIPVDEATTFVI